MLKGGWGCRWGEAAGWMPLPTRPQRYCDPASLVSQSPAPESGIFLLKIPEGSLGDFPNVENFGCDVHFLPSALPKVAARVGSQTTLKVEAVYIDARMT